MVFNTGTTLGAYEIKGVLGVGGMGEVYRARDSNLDREVAIKVLPEQFGQDPEKVARFRREARVLASLNHPNIANIHDLQEISGKQLLVLELVDGETLATRIAHGPMELPEILEIANQIAGALEAAHEKGIVHRDLKPANIKITPEGRVKVLDFGLAKVYDAEPTADISNSPTLTLASMRTNSGVILGTASYMSPEQARGKPVDKRADIWAFGAVLYEMLTGRKAFDGETVSDILVSVLSRDVGLNALPPTVPSKIRDLLRRCLQRDGTERLRDIGDARIEIAEALTAGPAVPALEAAPAARRRPVILSIVLLTLGVLIGVALGWFSRPTQSQDSAQSWIGTQLGGPEIAWNPRASPDGKTLAFLAMVDGLTQVAVMNPESSNWTVLTKDRSRGWVSTVSWSQDGTRIYYTRYQGVPRGIYSVPALGGEERLILENASGAEPLPDGSLVVARINADRRTQLYRYQPRDGQLDPLPGILVWSEQPAVRVVPGRSLVVFAGRSIDQAASNSGIGLYLLDIAKGSISKIPADKNPNSISLAVMPDGQWVATHISNGDLRRLLKIPVSAAGRTVPLMDLQQTVIGLDVGPDGSLYADQRSRPGEILQFGPSGGGFERINARVNARLMDNLAPLHLPDGRTLATAAMNSQNRLLVLAPGKDATPFVETDEPTSAPAVLLGKDRVAFFIGSGTQRRIAIASLQDKRIVSRIQNVTAASAMAASPDGRTLYYAASGVIWSIPSAGGEPRRIHSGDSVAVTPDGKNLVIQLVEAENVRWVKLALDSGMEQPIVVKSEFRFSNFPLGPGAMGPDGRIIVPIGTSDSWFWQPAVFDPNTGSVQRIPMNYAADFMFPAWTSDGKIIVVAYPLLSSIWRFRPTNSTNK